MKSVQHYLHFQGVGNEVCHMQSHHRKNPNNPVYWLVLFIMDMHPVLNGGYLDLPQHTQNRRMWRDACHFGCFLHPVKVYCMYAARNHITSGEREQDANDWNGESPIFFVSDVMGQAAFKRIHLLEYVIDLSPIRASWVVLHLDNYEPDFLYIEVSTVVQV